VSNGFDVIVLGAGAAGEHCAGALAGDGARVALVERELADGGLKVAVVERERVAGECTYWACIPSKTLLRPGEALAGARHAPGAREAVTGEIDAVQALAWRDYMVSGYDDSAQAAWLASKDIELIRGSGHISAPGEVTVGEHSHRAAHIVLATGSEPFVPPVPGLREADGVWTNREATGLKELPRRLIVLGGGPVGVELAQALARMGVSIALVEGMEHVLPREPRPLGEALGEALAADGVELRLGALASAVRKEGADFVVSFPDGDELRGDRLLVATGRRPRVQGIGLESVGLEANPRGVEVDARMATPAEGVWAIGDVTGVWPLTYMGKYQGRVAAENILGGDRRVNYDAVPRVTFTDPQAAAVGDAEGELTVTVPLKDVPRTATYRRDWEEERGFLTLMSDGERLTGAYALGPDAGEWLQQATVAIRARVPLEVLRDTIQPFPTFSEIFLSAFEQLAAKVPVAA
jgi:pyruvate/2-oxoglutarate dehydrogenase complex dihydrolipoamide dehydrogenase (E3) component